mmetsp:Transcript_46299/g.83491  ORF Transcript_46299/g.83491 Transcript_46299/m.83491 type:complete len:255 (-) Transcript_46299:568-1332(-)
MATLGSPADSKNAASWMMQVVHEPQSANPSITDLHSVVILFRSSSGHGRLKVGLLYLLVSSPSDRSFASKTSSNSLPRALLISMRATGPSRRPVLWASCSRGVAISEVGSKMSDSVPSSFAGVRSRAVGLGSTLMVTGWDMFAVGMPGTPAPKPGMKQENFPALAPATAMLKDPGLENFGTDSNGLLRNCSTAATRLASIDIPLHKNQGQEGFFIFKTCSTICGRKGTTCIEDCFHSSWASFFLESKPPFRSLL